MPILTVTTSQNSIYLLAGALEDIVFHEIDPCPASQENMFTFTLEQMSVSVRDKVRECLKTFGVQTYAFDDEPA